MARKWGSSVEDIACAGSVEKLTQFDGVVYDHTDSDEPTQFQRVVGEHEEPTQFQGVAPVNKKGKGLVHSSSDRKHVPPDTVISRPKPRQLKQAKHHVQAPVHVKAASKAASELNKTDRSDANDKLPQCKLHKLKPSQPKSEVVKVKEELKETQEVVRKSLEGQKRMREMVKKAKEIV